MKIGPLKMFFVFADEQKVQRTERKTKGTNNGTVFIKFIFDKPGEYVMTANLCSIDDPKFENESTDDYYEFTITVTE